MALPRKFMAARMTNSTLGSLIDNNSADTVDLGGLGSLETAICEIFGFTVDSDITASALSLDNSGHITKNLVLQKYSGTVGWRLRNEDSGKEMRIVNSGTTLDFDENTGNEAAPVWTNRFKIAISTGVLTGNTFSTTAPGLAPVSDGSATKYLSADGTYTVPSSFTATSCRLGNTSNQNITTGSFQALSFDTEVWDVGSMHAGGAPTRITFPSDGKYMIVGAMAYSENVTGRRWVQITTNGSTALARNEVFPTVGGATHLTVTGVHNAVAGDYAELKAWQDSGSTLVSYGSGTFPTPVFSAYKIGG